MHNVQFIADKIRRENAFDAYEAEWEYVAKVIDRLFLWIFTITTVAGSAYLILYAPALYDTSEPLPRRCRLGANSTTVDIPYDCDKKLL